MRALYFRPVLQIATRPDTTAKRGRVPRIVMAAALRARAGVAKLASSWRISFSFSSQSTRFASAGGLASNRASARASAAEADRLLEAWVETAFSIAALQFLGSGDGSLAMITYFAQRSPRAVAANRCICSSCASRTLSGRATVTRPSVDEPGRNALQLPFNAAAARDAVRTCPENAIIDVPPSAGTDAAWAMRHAHDDIASCRSSMPLACDWPAASGLVRRSQSNQIQVNAAFG